MPLTAKRKNFAKPFGGLEEEAEQLRAEIQKMKNSQERAPLETVRKKVEAGAKVSGEIRYGASVIGKTVVEAARCCNSLTGNSVDQNVKERVNLILGRTEVTKAEILKWISSDLSYEEKCQRIDEEFLSAQDYFASMMAQTE